MSRPGIIVGGNWFPMPPPACTRCVCRVPWSDTYCERPKGGDRCLRRFSTTVDGHRLCWQHAREWGSLIRDGWRLKVLGDSVTCPTK